MAGKPKIRRWKGKLVVPKKCTHCGKKKDIVLSDKLGRCADCKKRLEEGDNLSSVHTALRGKGGDSTNTSWRSDEFRKEREIKRREVVRGILGEIEKKEAGLQAIRASMERLKAQGYFSGSSTAGRDAETD